jgi:class 3 adenylate cyclase
VAVSAPGLLYTRLVSAGISVAPAGSRLRPWQRLSVRLAALFAIVTLVAVGLVGGLVYQRQKREVEDTVGTQLLNIARVAALLIDPAVHAEVERTRSTASPAYRRLQSALAAVRTETLLPTPVYTLTDLDAARRQARLVVTSDESAGPRLPYPLAAELVQPLTWSFEDGVARYTGIYRNASGMWISAFAPVPEPGGKTRAVLVVDYAVEIYLERLRELQATILLASLAGALGATVVGVLVARRITRPVSALTDGVARVAVGDLSQALPVRSNDEVGRLTRAFNDMLEGLRQRDFIRDTFGRYVSPEVAKTLLESPEGLKLGGEKRVVTILMSDLRGYTRFAEQGDPAWVMEVLNGYLARMTEIIIGYGGTINEFIGDAVFAIFGAPIPHQDHAERAAAAALAMQCAMTEINDDHVGRGLPRFEMGIGVNTGEAVVGNIGSAQRAKYAVVGSAVNVAARVEGSTVGGQIFLSAATWGEIRDLAEAAPPIPVEVKGLSEPLMLYELHGLRGRFAQRLPEVSTESDPQMSVALPVVCSVIEGKVIRQDTLRGVVRSLGIRQIDVRFEAPLSALTNVRLRITYPGLGHDSGDLYGKVVTGTEDPTLTRIRFTSVDAIDQKIIAAFLEG